MILIQLQAFQFHFIILTLVTKLKPSFLQECKVLEKEFRHLIPEGTIENEFVDFLQDRYDDVQNMKEKQFLEYILNVRSELYPNFLRYRSPV